jgi:hypothetical protein
MQIQQASFKPGDDVAAALAPLSAIAPQLVLVFAAPQFFSGSGARSSWRPSYMLRFRPRS